MLAVNERAAGLYRKGVYGNTMTTNPRALDVACAVLDALTPQLRDNIRKRGVEAVEKLEKLKAELGGLITKVQGTGLLFSCELSPAVQVLRRRLDRGVAARARPRRDPRRRQFAALHPALRHHRDELDLLVGMVGRALREGPRAEQAAAA